MKFSRRDTTALQRENAALLAELVVTRQQHAALQASCRCVIDELSKAELIHKHPDGTTRRGRFFEVLAFDEMQRAVGTDSGGQAHVE